MPEEWDAHLQKKNLIEKEQFMAAVAEERQLSERADRKIHILQVLLRENLMLLFQVQKESINEIKRNYC